MGRVRQPRYSSPRYNKRAKERAEESGKECTLRKASLIEEPYKFYRYLRK